METKYQTLESNTDIFDRMRAGEVIRKDDPGYDEFGQIVARTIRLKTTRSTHPIAKH